MKKLSAIPYPAGTQGAGMTLEITILPLTVSFYQIQFLEVPGPASEVKGYFSQFPASRLTHQPGVDWAPVGYDNKCPAGCTDTAAASGYLPPYSFRGVSGGSFVWHIPYKYRCNATGSGTQFTTIDQTFSITGSGTTTITKAGASVTRSP